MILFPNAKINIGLNIVSKRPDGFRNLESCFYPVQWCDALEILPAETMQFSLSGIPVPGAAETNLCLKAYELLKADYDLPPVFMHLHKNIPIGAGMGGGSADSAFALKLLNDLFKLNISTEQLEDYARRLGSDCAFFIRNKPVFAIEKGDIFQDIKLDLTGYGCTVVYPDLHITTAEAYSQVVPQAPAEPLLTALQENISTWQETVKNDFEAALFPRYPVIGEVKAQLYQAGALYAAMTGSGSAVFGIFPKEQAMELTFPAAYRVWRGLL
ncbi:4-(cytidine 5'-diphospho)-2-C-methyl-D-erythritol kinase [Adhaeribacter rhizoryzae]|uniref:4-diphosphocytidyl-2-C-methyl-D-erythritol kinase n=1 Tax=Adhaeribacter rhizoryzae TaxID=2607907 RepID=A0A5M6DKI9_9BACT|nr:4-(cytidine 5'-diphospho)-2-C-methyl-D-erythritol kinase [Adhaeribacter rhizoryzae]KAA5546710.1 4-(cytidine 5'-diphospho)-2-C-methyl-D-erythritol kinase [Adhaeribacter rhizoryzae]